MLVFYNSIVKNTNWRITVIFDSCFFFFLLPKASYFKMLLTEKVYFLLKKSCIEKVAALKKIEALKN